MIKWIKRLLSGDPTNTIQTIAHMNHIYDAIKNHLEMKTNGALLITGKWGSGKTHYLKKKVFPKLERDLKVKSIMVSLYGATDKISIANKILFAYLDKGAEEGGITVASFAKGAQKLIDSLPFLKRYVDVNQLVTGSGEGIFRLLPTEGLLICFDDLERVSEKLSTEDLLGLINELVENRSHKVVIVANEQVIKNGIKFKEKTIEKTVLFRNNLSEIFDSIQDDYADDDFKKFLQLHKDFFLMTLDPAHADRSLENNLRDSFENIRTIKFAIEHFQYVFKILAKHKDVTDELVIKQVKNIWYFVRAVVAEFKKEDMISFENRKGLDEVSETGFLWEDFAWGETADSQTPTVEVENYSETFLETYYKKFAEPFIFYAQVYNLITGSVPMDEAELLAELETGFKLREGKINPAAELLNSFVYNHYFEKSEEQFKQDLSSLVGFAEKGDFDDANSYLNAGVYLLGFSGTIGLDKQEIVKRVEKGIQKFIARLPEVERSIHEVEVAASHYIGEGIESLVAFLKAELKAKDIALEAGERGRLQELFISSMPALLDELKPKGPTRSPDPLLFNYFEIPKVQAAIDDWKPADFKALSELLQIRYIGMSFFERMTEEIPFLSGLLDKINKMNFDGKSLSLHIVNGQLRPNLIECIKKLTAVKTRGENRAELAPEA